MATLLTFRLDVQTRDRVRARLSRDGITLSAVVTRGLRDYVSGARGRELTGDGTGSRVRELPEHVVAWLRDLRSAGSSQALSAALAELHGHGWPFERLAQALGVSKQAVQARVRRAARGGSGSSGSSGAPGSAGASGAPGSAGASGSAAFVPALVRRRPPAADARPHLTVRIDQGLRATAHRVAADDGHTVSQVVEAILDYYLRRGFSSKGSPSEPVRTDAAERENGSPQVSALSRPPTPGRASLLR